MVCAVFGHRKIEEDKAILKEKVFNEIIKLIEEKQVDTFLFGRLGEFDDLCYEVVTELKNLKYSYLERIYCCEDEKLVNNPFKMPTYIKHGYENIVFLPMAYRWFYKRIYFRNCEMIKKSDFCLFYIRREEGGAYKAYEFARKLKKQCFML